MEEEHYFYPTDVGNAIKIARQGAILSPLREEYATQLHNLKHAFPHMNETGLLQLIQSKFQGKTLEEVARGLVTSNYRELRENPEHIENVFLTPDLSLAFSKAEQYETPSSHGGVILEFTPDVDLLSTITFKGGDFYAFPQELSMRDNLTTVHLLPGALAKTKLLKKQFLTYNPTFKAICSKQISN